MATSVSSLLPGPGTKTGHNRFGTANNGSNTGLGQDINVSSFLQGTEADQQAQITNVQTQQNTINTEWSTLATPRRRAT